MKACQMNDGPGIPVIFTQACILSDIESSSRFSHVGLHFLSTGAAVNSSESLPPSSSVNDISSMSTDQTLASDTDSSLEASAGPLGCCRWLAACLRNPAFFRRWCDGTHTHTRRHSHTHTNADTQWQENSKEKNPSLKLKQIFQPASSPEFCIAAKPNVYLT